MSTNWLLECEEHKLPMWSSQFTHYSNNFVSTSPSLFINNSSYSIQASCESQNPRLLSSNTSEYNSLMVDLGINRPMINYQEPIYNPHQRFLTRTIGSCHKYLTGRNRARWQKAGLKTQQNQQILSNLNPFYWPETKYDQPIHIHHQSPKSLLQGLIHKISQVQLYAIATQSDKPTHEYIHAIPALIQIHAIHDESYTTIILIEVQHLPRTSTFLFRLIQQLFTIIFSSKNKIFAWGDVQQELRSFEQFNLFDLSNITNILNLQKFFTDYWNETHPHTVDCLARHQPTIDEPESDDILVCLVNTDDLNDDFDTDNPSDDYQGCICPNETRPYKVKNAVWSLQKAIHFVFNQALNKSLTINTWSYGLDPLLTTWHNGNDKRTRFDLILYAINDVFACTSLYYHINKSIPSSQRLLDLISINSVTFDPIPELPTYFVLSDSHGKYLPPITTTSSYKLIVRAISGLQWVNQFDTSLSAQSLLTSSTIHTFLSSCNSVLLIIGTNSIRNTSALEIIHQIDQTIDIIRTHHSHLTNKTAISIANVFPCYKPSANFPSNLLLSINLNHYNTLLKDLSIRKNISIVDLLITNEHLGRDNMHIAFNHLSFLYNNIQNYFDKLVIQRVQLTRNKRRSQMARTRRNKKRHNKLKLQQQSYTVVRFIDRIWKLQDLKAYLAHKSIKYNRLPEIINHQLRIQFRNSTQQQHAETNLKQHDFDKFSYLDWISHVHS